MTLMVMIFLVVFVETSDQTTTAREIKSLLMMIVRVIIIITIRIEGRCFMMQHRRLSHATLAKTATLVYIIEWAILSFTRIRN